MPSARANGGFNTQSRFSSYASVEWAEDDAWDSGSDSDSGTKKTVSMSKAANSIKIPFESTTTAKPVPGPKRSPSSSSLTFSYTHVNTPSPSSYSPKPDNLHSHKAGWTMVSKSTENGARTPNEAGTHEEVRSNASEDFDIEDIDVGDTDAEGLGTKSMKQRRASNVVRQDAETIVQGMFSLKFPVIMMHQLNGARSHVLHPVQAAYKVHTHETERIWRCRHVPSIDTGSFNPVKSSEEIC